MNPSPRGRRPRRGASTHRLGSPGRAGLVPALAGVHHPHHQQHHRDLDQDPDHGGQGRAGLEAEERDGRRHRQLKEVAGPDQGRGTGDAVLLTDRPVQPVGQGGVEEDLDQDGDRQHRDDQRLLEDLLALKGEQQHQGRQQGDDGGMPQGRQGGVELGLTLLEQEVAPHLSDPDRDQDVEHHRRQERIPGHRDRRESQQQRHDGGEGKDHDGVIERHLGQGEIGVTAGEPAPDEDHGRAGCGGQ